MKNHQMANSAAPRGLGYWRRHLASVDWVLVSAPEVLDGLLSVDQFDSSLLEAIHCDLPLGLAILMEGQSLLMRKGAGVTSIAHAVGMLGQNRIQSLIRKFGERRLDAAKPGHLRYAQALMTSRLAGHLLLQFAGSEKREETQALVWSLQAHTVAEWKLPLAAPDLVEELMHRLDRGERSAHIEMQLLGCRLHELNAAVAQDMGLQDKEAAQLVQALPPRMLGLASRLAWVDVYPPAIPTEVGRWLFQPSTLPSLLHMLAHEVMLDWYSARSTLLMKVLSAHRNKRLDEVLLLTRRAALAASREPNLSHVVAAPALRLLWPAAQRRLRTAPTPLSKPLAPASSESGQAAGQNMVDVFVTDCEQERHANLAAFFKAFARALDAGLGLKRYALFLRTSQEGQLVCFAAQGFSAAIAPRRYAVSLKDNNLLARLFAQPHGCLMAEPARCGTVRPMLPPALRDELRPCGALWATVQVNERPVGVLWADSGEPAAPVQMSQYAGFKLLSRHYGQALTRLMKQQKQAAAAP